MPMPMRPNDESVKKGSFPGSHVSGTNTPSSHAKGLPITKPTNPMGSKSMGAGMGESQLKNLKR